MKRIFVACAIHLIGAVAPFLVSAQSVDLLTGNLQFSIPLGGLQSNDIEIPVTLNYHGQSPKIYDGNGSCGIGWSLSVGGAVYRNIRGLPDDYSSASNSLQGWLLNNNASAIQNFNPSADDNLAICSDEQNDWNFLTERGYSRDTEPDIFYIRAPGLNVQFVFDANGIPRFLSYANLQIQVIKNTNQAITGFIVKNNLGLAYHFTIIESVNRRSQKIKSAEPKYFTTFYRHYNYPAGISYISTWHLSKIESVATGTYATFTYQSGEETISVDFVTSIKQSTTNKGDSVYYLLSTSTPLYLNEVLLKNNKVVITWNNRLIKRIQFIEASTADEKIIDFSYVPKKQYTGTLRATAVKHFLKEFRAQKQCNSFPSFKFNYIGIDLTNEYDVSIPWESNNQQDWFGYFNGVVGNYNVPSVYFYSTQSDARRLRVQINGTPTTTLSGTNRTPSVTAASVGALSRIDFPSGGYTSIDYELNTYRESGIADDLPGPGIRVRKLETNGTDIAYGKSPDYFTSNNYRSIIKEYEYKLEDNSSSGKLINSIALAFATGDSIIRTVNNLDGDPYIMYSRIKEKINGQGSIVHEYDIPGTFPSVTDGTWSATKSRIARNSSGGCVPAGNLKNGYYTFPFAPSCNYDYARGLLTRVSEYSETGTLVKERTLTYSTINPTVVRGLRFEKIGEIFHYGLYQVLTGGLKVLSSETIKIMSEVSPSQFEQTTVTYSYNTSNMPQMITSYQADGSVLKQKIKYVADFSLSSATDTASIALKALKDNYLDGLVIEEIASVQLPGGAEVVTGANYVTYRNYSNNRILPHKTYILPAGAPLTEAYVSGGTIVHDADYRKVKWVEYDDNSYLINVFDDRKNVLGKHYAVYQGSLLATFTYAKADQALYEGFEYYSGRGFTSSGAIVPGRTGSNAVELIPPAKLISSTVNKGENVYRVSFWMKSSTTTTVTIRAKNGTTTQNTVTVQNPINNQWTYLETEMSMTGVSSVFNMEIESSNSAVFDDIVVLPRSARVAFTTFKPHSGITSSTDDRGNSMLMTYDDHGRLLNTFDRNRNLIKHNEYVYVNEDISPITATFTSSVIGAYTVGTPVTFTASPNCYPVVYSWSVYKDSPTPLATGTNPTFVYTFQNLGFYNVKLSVSSEYGSHEFIHEVCVTSAPILTQLQVTHQAQTNPLINYSCNENDNIKTFSFQQLQGSYFPQGTMITYRWDISTDGSNWLELNPNYYNGASINYPSPPSTYTIRCRATIKFPDIICYSGNATAEIKVIEHFATIQFISNPPCQ